MIELEKLPKFIHHCMTIGEIPTSYKYSLTYEEQLMWFCKFLQDQVIPVVNNNSEAVQELQTFVENYFNNLDVQEEVNNKLEEMLESGQLEELITQYLNIKGMLCFDNVSLMKNATNLIEGSFARTMGYYSVNDGGAGIYKIRAITNDDVVDEGSIIEMADNNLVAELIDNGVVNAKQFGAKGDEITDDTQKIKNAITYCTSNNKKLFLDKSTYLISSTLEITSNNFILECLGTLKITSNITLLKVKGRDLNIKIEKLLSTNRTGIGLYVLGLTTFTKIDINEILDFDIGIDVNTSIDSTDGVLYTYFYNSLIIANKCVYLNANNGYINQNYFYLGEVAGNIGIETETLTNYSDNYNGNVFFNVGFENLAGAGINLHDVTKSTFKDFRYYENSPASKFIILDNCKNCLFESNSVSAVLQNGKIQDNTTRNTANVFNCLLTQTDNENSQYARKCLSYNGIFEIIENGNLPNEIECSNGTFDFANNRSLNMLHNISGGNATASTIVYLDEKFNYYNEYTKNLTLLIYYISGSNNYQIYKANRTTKIFDLSDWRDQIVPGKAAWWKFEFFNGSLIPVLVKKTT